MKDTTPPVHPFEDRHEVYEALRDLPFVNLTFRVPKRRYMEATAALQRLVVATIASRN